MELDSHTVRLLGLMDSANLPPIPSLDAAAARAQNDPLAEKSEHDPEPVAAVEDRFVHCEAGRLPVRIYRPIDAPSRTACLLYYHGGGGVIGHLDTHDSVCRTLANSAGCTVISVAYRLGPEHRFPAGLEDAAAAYDWADAHATALGIVRSRIAVGGDSCGAGLAAALAHRIRDNGGTQPFFQLLICPAVDANRGNAAYPSYLDCGEGYFLDHALCRWFLENYIEKDQNLHDTGLSPLHARDFSRLPQALVITAGFDPLRDEGAAYANALRNAGVDTEYLCYDSTIHGFTSMGRFLPMAVDALKLCGGRLRAAAAIDAVQSAPEQ